MGLTTAGVSRNTIESESGAPADRTIQWSASIRRLSGSNVLLHSLVPKEYAGLSIFALLRLRYSGRSLRWAARICCSRAAWPSGISRLVLDVSAFEAFIEDLA